MDRALQKFGSVIWLAGLRKSQTKSRSQLHVLRNKTAFINYIQSSADDKETYQYLPKRSSYHPLEGMGYESLEIGIVQRKFRKFKIKKRLDMEVTVGSVDCILNLPRTWTSPFNFMILPDDKTRLELIKEPSIFGSFECDEKRKRYPT